MLEDLKVKWNKLDEKQKDRVFGVLGGIVGVLVLGSAYALFEHAYLRNSRVQDIFENADTGEIMIHFTNGKVKLIQPQ